MVQEYLCCGEDFLNKTKYRYHVRNMHQTRIDIKFQKYTCK